MKIFLISIQYNTVENRSYYLYYQKWRYITIFLWYTFSGYAARAFSSVDVENIHSIINYQDRRGVQTSSVEEMTRHISNLQRLQLLRRTQIGERLYAPSSTIYHTAEVGSGLSQQLTCGQFDLSIPSKRCKETVPHSRHDPPRGLPRVRDLGHHKSGESSFMKS